MNNKSKIFLSLFLGIFLMLGAIYVFAVDSIPTIGPVLYLTSGGSAQSTALAGTLAGRNSFATTQNLSGVVNISVNFTHLSVGSGNFSASNVTNLSWWYSTDNTTWTKINATGNTSSALSAMNFTWNTAFDLDEKANISILIIGMNATKNVHPDYLHNTTLNNTAGIGNGATSNNTMGNATYNISYGMDIDNIAPRIVGINVTDSAGNVILNETTGAVGGLPNATRSIQNGSDVTISVLVNETLLRNVTISWHKNGTGTYTVADLAPLGGLRNATAITKGTNLYMFQYIIKGGNFSGVADSYIVFNVTAEDLYKRNSTATNANTSTLGSGYVIYTPSTSSMTTDIALSTTTPTVQDPVKITCSTTLVGNTINSSTYTITVENPKGAQTAYTNSEVTISGTDTGEPGTYRIWCSAQDLAKNLKSSEIKQITVSYTGGSNPSGGSSGGGSGGTIEYDLDLTKVNEGTIAKSEGASATLTIDGTTSHTITYDKITDTSATITIASDPITMTLNVGETKEITLDGKKLSIMLKGIVSGQAQLNIKKVEATTEPTTPTTTETQTGTTAGEEATTVSNLTWLWVLIVIVVILVAVVYLVKKKKSY